MFSTKCDRCKKRPWSQCCDWCLGKPFHCFICNKSVTYREKHEQMQYHYYDKPNVMLCHLQSRSPDPNYTCKSCTKFNRNLSTIVIFKYN